MHLSRCYWLKESVESVQLDIITYHPDVVGETPNRTISKNSIAKEPSNTIKTGVETESANGVPNARSPVKSSSRASHESVGLQHSSPRTSLTQGSASTQAAEELHTPRPPNPTCHTEQKEIPQGESVADLAPDEVPTITTNGSASPTGVTISDQLKKKVPDVLQSSGMEEAVVPTVRVWLSRSVRLLPGASTMAPLHIKDRVNPKDPLLLEGDPEFELSTGMKVTDTVGPEGCCTMCPLDQSLRSRSKAQGGIQSRTSHRS